MESKGDLAINQAPITTKHLSLNYGINLQLLGVTKCKEESPYKPDRFKGFYQPKCKQHRNETCLTPSLFPHSGLYTRTEGCNS